MAKRRKLILGLLVAVLLPEAAGAIAGKDDALKRRLFDRYDKKQLTIVHDKVLVALLHEGLGGSGRGTNILEYSVNYDHFANFSKDQWPNKYKTRNLLDEYTTEEVEAGAAYTDALTPGEMVQVRLFYVNYSKSGVLALDLYVVPLAGKRTASTQNIYSDGGAGVSWKVDWGCHFRFIIPPKAPQASDAEYFKYITETIGRYFLPTQEYLDAKKTALEVEKSAKNVELRPGMSKEEVLKALGEPEKAVVFGAKTILKYRDLTVELEGNKVVNVKTN